MSQTLNIKVCFRQLALACMIVTSLAHAQQSDLRGVIKRAPSEYDLYPYQTKPAERYYAVERAIPKATAETMAALNDNDPLLADIYVMTAGRLDDQAYDANLSAIYNDMKRRGDVAVQILLDEFNKPSSLTSRVYITALVMKNDWLKPEIFRPLIVKWYHDVKSINDPGHRSTIISQFLARWGHSEDEAILREILPDAPNGTLMRQFHERLERLKQGQNHESK